MTQTSTKQIKWQQKTFSELTNTELFDLYKLRVATFVVAQKRIYQEVDEQDPVAIHILGYDGDELVAYSRVFRTGDTVTFGRVVTAQSHRGIGLGNDLMREIIATIKANFGQLPVEIEAQIQVQGYYKKFDFDVVGEPFIFNSTPHIKMVHKPVYVAIQN